MIDRRYDEMEKELIEEFVAAQKKDDFNRMKEMAHVLSNFKGYSQCVDAYIEHSQEGCLRNKDVFSNILELCQQHYQVIQKVFNRPDQVMAKFILNIINLKLNEYVRYKLDNADTCNYLPALYELYTKVNQLTNDLCCMNMGNDKDYLNKLTNNIFSKYLERYMGWVYCTLIFYACMCIIIMCIITLCIHVNLDIFSVELRVLKEKNAANLKKYYESKSHQKKPIQSGGFQDLRRDLQAVIGTRTNFNLINVDNYGGETFLSEELAITILQDSKHALERCKVVSNILFWTMEKKNE